VTTDALRTYNREWTAAWRAKNPEAARAKDRAYYAAHPETRRRYELRRKFDLAPEQYAEMLEAQGGACAVCRKEDRRALSVDHDHQTGRVRGLLCSTCNQAIGLLGDDAAALRAALAYLEGGP